MLDTSRDPAADPSAQDTPGSIATVCATILELPPSCVEFSPKWPQCFVIGTYHLEDNDRALDGGDESGGQHAEGHDASCGNKPPLRNGSLILCQLRDNAM
jgi:diphthine methyl ester acylhydrolase